MFSIRNWIQGEGIPRTLAAVGLLVAAGWSAAASGSAKAEFIPVPLVVEADVIAAKNVLLKNPKQASASLGRLKERLETYGVADRPTTVQNVYWLYSQAMTDIDCVAAYKSLYQSVALGFTTVTPTRVDVYQKRERALRKCIPADTQMALEQAGWAELRGSKLRDMADIGYVQLAQSPHEPTSKGIELTSDMVQQTANAVEHAEQAEKVVAQAQELAVKLELANTQDEPSKWKLKDIVEVVFRGLVVLVLLSIPFTMLGGLFSTGESSTSSSAKPANPTRPSSSGRQRNQGTHSAADKTKRAQRKRVGMVKMRPWG